MEDMNKLTKSAMNTPGAANRKQIWAAGTGETAALACNIKAGMRTKVRPRNYSKRRGFAAVNAEGLSTEGDFKAS